MSIFDRMLFKQLPEISNHQFTAQFDWLAYHLDVGGSIGQVEVGDIRTGWSKIVNDAVTARGSGDVWEASDDAELDALVTQANTAISNGVYEDWSEQFKGLFLGMENVLVANKVSKGEANQYLQAIANGTKVPTTITPDPVASALRR